MSARRFGTQSLVRLLGNWQETSLRTPLWRQLAEALRLLILDGRLTLQTRSPGERSWRRPERQPTTIASALGQLRRRAFSAARGAGHALFAGTPADLPLPAGISSLIYLPPPSAPGREVIRLPARYDPAAPYLAQITDQQGLPVLREAITQPQRTRSPTRPMR